MKSIIHTIKESAEKKMEIRYVDTADAMFEIFEDDKFPHLRDCIEAEGEAKYDHKEGQWKMQLVNNYDFSDNIYNNPYDDKVHVWIGGFIDGDNCIMLQLISLEEPTYIELVNTQKVKDSGVKDVFGQIVAWVEKEFPGKDIKTFPMNKDLDDYYQKHGFIRSGNELCKKAK